MRNNAAVVHIARTRAVRRGYTESSSARSAGPYLETVLPDFDALGDLPVGIHQASLGEVVQYFGRASTRRMLAADRLQRLYSLASETRCLARFIVFGSFVTAEPLPNDLDLFFLMEDAFDARQLTGEQAILFDHPFAQAYFSASVFWLRRQSALDGEQATIDSGRPNATGPGAGSWR